MKLEDLQTLIQSGIHQERQDIICHYAIHFMPKLIEIAMIAKEHVISCGDGAWFDPALAEALKKFESEGGDG